MIHLDRELTSTYEILEKNSVHYHPLKTNNLNQIEHIVHSKGYKVNQAQNLKFNWRLQK